MATRGRPAFKPTAAQRRRVEELVSCGMGEDAISRVIGIARNTLRTHFAEELLHGGERRRAEVIGLLFKTARSGNVTAQKKLEDMTALNVAAASFAEPAPAEAPAKAAKLGKKEEQALAASTAGQGTDWGDDLSAPSSTPTRVN